MQALLAMLDLADCSPTSSHMPGSLFEAVVACEVWVDSPNSLGLVRLVNAVEVDDQSSTHRREANAREH